ncbi:MAG: AGE family epimerase/isomerase [Ignavibacteriales bacterium]|nr:AGE family epimerase/isomerase [Ignavibacteriales bacterium]
MNTEEFIRIYRDGLLHDTIPFWIPRAVDRQYGGFFNALDMDGSILHTDKSVWLQGRFSWTLATLYSTVEQKQEWLDLSRHGIEFLQKHCFGSDGRMFFWVTQEGKPLRKRRYVFSEIFAVMAFAAYGKAAGDSSWTQRSLELFKKILFYLKTPGLLEPKIVPETRPMKGLAMLMSLISAAQALHKAIEEPLCVKVIDDCIAELERDFLKPEFRCLLENVGPKGEFYDTLDGRQVNPGHSIEAGWFILDEARRRNNDPHLIKLGTTIIDWSYEIGWDPEFGGLLYFKDAKKLPPTEYWHDMKFWWPHNEAIIATLMAYQLTGDEKYLGWHKDVHEWAYKHFPDPVHGEWFGYLHRDGSLSTRVKGTMWKGPFHLPRMQLYCWKMLEEKEKVAAK